MSNRKVFQAAPRPKASQANTLDTNLSKIDANSMGRKRRTGMRKLEVSVPTEEVKDEDTPSRKGSKQEEKLPELSPKKEIPQLKLRLNKTDVKGTQLKKPMGLKQRKIPNIFDPKKEKKETSVPLTMAEIEKQEDLSESDGEEGLDANGDLKLTARLMGMPGNLAMDAEMTSKYFGIEGRAKFHDRVGFILGQRAKACVWDDDDNQPLYFRDQSEGDPSRSLAASIPFGANRRTERGEFIGTLDEDEAAAASVDKREAPRLVSSLGAGGKGLGSRFFSRFKNPVQQAEAGLGYITPSGRLDGYNNNDAAMLRMSRLRSGDDPRDEEDDDAAFPLRADARMKDMDEAYVNMMLQEAKHEEEDYAVYEQKQREMELMIGMQQQQGGVRSNQPYSHDADGSLVLGGDYSLASVGEGGDMPPMDPSMEQGQRDEDRNGDDNQDYGLADDHNEEHNSSDEDDEDREKRIIREMVRLGKSSKSRSWKRSYVRKHASKLEFADTDDEVAVAERGASMRRSMKKQNKGDSDDVAMSGRALASVTVSTDELKRLQRLAVNNAVVSNITFEALSLANQQMGEIQRDSAATSVFEGGKDVDEGAEEQKKREGDDEGDKEDGDGADDNDDDGSAGSDDGSVDSNTRKQVTRAAEGVVKYQYMQLSMSQQEKQQYYANRRPSLTYDKAAEKPKPDYALPKRRYFHSAEKKIAGVGTGGLNHAEALRKRAQMKQESKQQRQLQSIVAGGGQLSPMDTVHSLRQISSLPRDNSIFSPMRTAPKASDTGDGAIDDGQSQQDDDDDSVSYFNRASSRRTSISSTDSISTLNLRMSSAEAGYSQAAPLSPRSKFISNCVRERLNPRAGLLVRKSTTKKLELQNYGMGDQMARILADSIADLPYLQSINIADNRLTDEGMGPIILAAVKIEDLLELNLSKNEIGDVSSDALAQYLKDPACTLQRLVMQTADVDDFEAAPFIDAVKENRSLLELDLTDNLIGGAENLNTVMPDLITGSEAIADLLREPDIRLHTLKLPWNMIRLDGGVDLCSSLTENTTLTYLDLSYNSLGNDGGTALGMALERNTTLATLIIANNNIDAVACFTICNGVIHNRHLTKIVFDGNPIAEQGARALMLVPIYAGGRVEVSAKKCNITMRDPRCWFDFDKPCKTYKLDMEDGFERAVCMILLLVIACHHSYVFESIEVFPDKESSKGMKEIKLKQALSRERMKYFQAKETTIVNALTKIKDSAADINAAIRLFQEVDEDGSGEIDREEFAEMVRQMGIGMSEERIDEVYATYDVDGGGSIGLSEFLAFLKTQKAEASARIDDLCETPIMTLDDGIPIKDSRGKIYDPWMPPSTGRIEIEVIDGFVEKEIKKTMSSVDQANIQNVIAAAGDGGGGQAAGMVNHAISGVKLRLDEALSCCSTMVNDGKDATKIMRMVLPNVSNFEDAQAVVKAITNGDRTALMKLKREVGDSLRPILGAPNGYYQLDLTDDMDRFCLTRLIEISSTNAKKRKEANSFYPNTQIGDLSQKRNWTSFRNEMFNGEPVEIDVAFASPLPRMGHLQFDFVCGSYIRPRPDDMVMTDSRVVKILCNSFLLEPEDCMSALKKLKHYFVRGEAALDCDGHTIFETPTKRAHHIGLHTDDFYDNIHLRRKEYEETNTRENQVQYDTNGAAIDDLDEDDHDPDHCNDTSGFTFSSSKSLAMSMAMKGQDLAKMTRKQRKTLGRSDDAFFDSNKPTSEAIDEHDKDGWGSDEDSTTLAESQVPSVGVSGPGSVDGDGDDAENNSQFSADPDMWKCPKCFTKNITGANGDHCTLCNASNPGHVHGHGIDAEIDANAFAGEEDKILKDAQRKKGNVEGSHKTDPNMVIDPNDPKALLVKLSANEEVMHKKNEMAQNAEESDIEEPDSIHNSSDTDSSNSDEELDGDEETDMAQYVEIKIAERKEAARKKREEEREKRRAERRAAKLEEKKKRALLLGESMPVDGDDEEKGDDDEEDGDGATSTQKKIMAGLNLLSNKQIEDQMAANEASKKRDEYIAKDRAEGDAISTGKDAEALEETAVQKEKRVTDAEKYALKMKEVLEKKAFHIGLKARRVVEWLEELFGRSWIWSRQLALILEIFRGIGHKKQTRHFGTYRVELFVLLFHRVVDMHNIELVLKVLSPYEVACVNCRIGWLHLFNPCKPEGGWEVNLTRPEERLVAKMLCELATVEPGDNWIEQYFQWQRDSEGMPGWELTTPWLSEDGLPCRGVLCIMYYSGGGKLLRGCSPNVPFRKSLLHLCLIEESEIVEEGFRDRPPTNLVGDAYVYSNPGRWKQYLGAIVDLTRTR
jgi:hypothetical protein